MQLTTIRNSALLLGLMAGLLSCDALKGPEVTLTADKETIAAGGYEYTTITATVMMTGEPAVGVEVAFETDLGSFSDSMDLTDTYIATDSAGVATIQLWGPADQGQTAVRVSYYDDESGLTAEDQITITFGPPQAGNLPVDGKFHIDCDYPNLGALRQPKPDIQMTCEISAQTTAGDNVPTDALDLFFMAEAGVLEEIEDAWSGETVIRYSVRGGNVEPQDVDPIPGEPWRTGSLGGTRNPRDGVVTLLAIARGSECWTDLNGNGTREENEPFGGCDLDEPFLDVDDDGQYTPGVDEYFDANADGEWTPANGQHDEDTFIFATAKVVWTGLMAEDAAAGNEAARLEHEPASTSIPNGGSLSMFIYLLDDNLNPIAAFADNGDYIELLETSGYVTFTPGYTIDLSNGIGMEFDTSDPWLPIQQFYPDAGKYTVTVRDYDGAYVNDPAVAYAIDVKVYNTPGPEGDGYWLSQEQDWFTYGVEGDVL